MDIQARQYAAILKQNIAKDEYFKDFQVMPYRFIVVNRQSRNPLVWEWPYTFAETTVEIPNSKGYPYRMRNFKELGEELYTYLQTEPRVPEGISEHGVNKIDDWLKRM